MANPDYQDKTPVELIEIFERLLLADKNLHDRRPNLEAVRSELLRRLPKNPSASKYIGEITNRYNARRYFQSESKAEVKSWVDENYGASDKQAIIIYEGDTVYIA